MLKLIKNSHNKILKCEDEAKSIANGIEERVRVIYQQNKQTIN